MHKSIVTALARRLHKSLNFVGLQTHVLILSCEDFHFQGYLYYLMPNLFFFLTGFKLRGDLGSDFAHENNNIKKKSSYDQNLLHFRDLEGPAFSNQLVTMVNKLNILQ